MERASGTSARSSSPVGKRPMRHLRPDDPAKETPFLGAACEDRERAAVPQRGAERQGVGGYAAGKGDTVPRRAAGGHEAGGRLERRWARKRD